MNDGTTVEIKTRPNSVTVAPGRELVETSTYPLTPTDVRNGGKRAIVQLVARANDERRPPDIETAKALISWMIEDMQLSFSHTAAGEPVEPDVLYPPTALREASYRYDLPVMYPYREDNPDEYLPPGVTQSYPKGLTEYADGGYEVVEVVVFDALRLPG